MRKTRKIKAFTLSEMIVVIVVTAIVVGLAFSVLNLVQTQMKSMAQHYAGSTQWQLLEQSLWIDFHRYRRITYHDEAQELRLQHELDSVSYVFYADKVVKGRDTFFISVKTKALYHRGQPVQEGPVDALRLQPENYGEERKNLFVFKQNDASNTINLWHFN